jgi:EAL domain-containing protein (putative c-di-GMP-specific phosphodiesterase class I)
VQALKVDRGFVEGIAREGGQIVRAVIGLARDLEMGVVAEGVESEAQRTRLCALGCRYGQGFLFAPPLPAEEAAEMLPGREGGVTAMYPS